jgi:glycosyltransferase involved in cell wall biosynthesis
LKNQLNTILALSKIEEIDYEAKFYGEVDDVEYYEKCYKLIKELKLEHRIYLLPRISAAELYKEYEKADIIVLPSHSEGTPNVILESFAYGRLCIASNIIQHRDIFQNAAMLFDPNDVYEIHKKIVNTFYMSTDEKNIEIERNYNYVKRNYSTQNMVKDYYKLFFGD